MLVLERKLGEQIFIGDNICITVTRIFGGAVRLGIEAPRDVQVYRQEDTPMMRISMHTECQAPGATNADE